MNTDLDFDTQPLNGPKYTMQLEKNFEEEVNDNKAQSEYVKGKGEAIKNEDNDTEIDRVDNYD